MPTQRQIRVANRLREELAKILLREVEDPLVRSVTLTDVDVSPDLKHARVHFSVVGPDADPAETLKGLRRARRFIQRCLAEQADLRFTPTLEFRYDPTAARAQRVEELLRELHEDGSLPPGDAEDTKTLDGTNDEPDDPDHL